MNKQEGRTSVKAWGGGGGKVKVKVCAGVSVGACEREVMIRNYLRRPLLAFLLLASFFIHFYSFSYYPYSYTSVTLEESNDVTLKESNDVTLEESKDLIVEKSNDVILEESNTQSVLPIAEPLTEVKAMDHIPLSSTEMKKIFFEEGVVGPFHLLSKSERDTFLAKGRK